ncbi:MAG TPA: hypothetical protein DEG44_00690, partial [Candidatus Kerfeldbacteria bacterium]|nr:hypothetical protein [Candidatus Kerfeldbacteria bacterium]
MRYKTLPGMHKLFSTRREFTRHLQKAMTMIDGNGDTSRKATPRELRGQLVARLERVLLRLKVKKVRCLLKKSDNELADLFEERVESHLA